MSSIKIARDQKDLIDKCTKTLLEESNANPFPEPPIAVDLYNNPPLFCLGRDHQKKEIINLFHKSINTAPVKLIRVMGQQGIGKSTLICWCAKEINEGNTVPVVYIEVNNQPEDLNMRAIYYQIISNIENDKFLKNLIYKTISKFINLLNTAGGKLKARLFEKFSGDLINLLISNETIIIDKIKDAEFSSGLFKLLQDNYIMLKDYLPVDLEFLLVFWKSHLQNPEIFNYLKVFKGKHTYSGHGLETDTDASIQIDNLIKLFRWAFDNNTTFVLIFDHLEAGRGKQEEAVYSNLFSLLLILRKKTYLTIILSGTMDAYSKFREVLEKDQSSQLDNWAKTISLPSLKPDIIIDIVNKYLSLFWDNFNYNPPTKIQLFPFGPNSITYLYESNGQGLRETLRDLYDLIEQYRTKNKLEIITTFFDAFKVFRKRQDILLTATEQRELTNKLLDSKIQDKTRSTAVEKALCKFFKVLVKEPDYMFISDVQHDIPVGKSNKRPDVFLEFFGNSDLKSVKKMGIEVKTYRKTLEISKADIEKTYILLKENELDYISWITNVPLKLKYRYDLSEDLLKHMGRTKPLIELELAYLAFIRYFEEIYQREPSTEEAELILSKIGLSPHYLREELIDLPKLTIEKLPKLKKDITDYGKNGEGEKKKKGKAIKAKKKVPTIPIDSVEVGREHVEKAVKEFILKKSKTNKQVSQSSTIKTVKKNLKLAETDNKWDDDIWAIALEISKNLCVDQSDRLIYFRK